MFLYRKQELYEMEWADQVDLSRFLVAAAPYGGPIGKIFTAIFNILSRASEVGSPTNPPWATGSTTHGVRDPLVCSQVD